MRRVRQLAVLVFLAGSAAPAWAWQSCSTECSRYEEGDCVEHTQTCTEVSPPPAESFGAIAYGRTSGAYGFSYSWPSRAKAENVALNNCGTHGDDCEIMVWFDRKCGAVAAGQGSSAWWGLGDTDGQARAAALDKCANDGGEDCEVKVSRCSR
jgi:uncharacterized protein DUF4189